jgi:hypothetical protein
MLASVIGLFVLSTSAITLGCFYLAACFAEHFIQKSKKKQFKFSSVKDVRQPEDDQELSDLHVRFDFTNHDTKLVFAGAKLAIALMIGLLYLIVFKLVTPNITHVTSVAERQSKSLWLMAALIIVSIYRDKYEKRMASAKLHFGKAMLSPLIYVSFTLMTILDQSLGTFLLASVFQIGYCYFYLEESRQLIGVNSAREH